jgi:hypothetical protein
MSEASFSTDKETKKTGIGLIDESVNASEDIDSR